jgi:hypothetical protein
MDDPMNPTTISALNSAQTITTGFHGTRMIMAEPPKHEERLTIADIILRTLQGVFRFRRGERASFTSIIDCDICG